MGYRHRDPSLAFQALKRNVHDATNATLQRNNLGLAYLGIGSARSAKYSIAIVLGWECVPLAVGPVCDMTNVSLI